MTAATASGVRIERVSFSYGATTILSEVSLDVAKGEFFAFLGPSGSGKTTLLRLIAGFGAPGAGRIVIGERDVTAVPPWQRNVGMVFQNYALWPHMTVARNVAFGLERRRLPRAAVARKVRDALALVDLADFAERYPAQLSGGQQQRVALARTLVIEPALLLLDEPLSNLDAKLRVEMRGELLRLQRQLGLTTIYVTHDQEEANATADRMAVLDQGRLQQIGAPMELYDRPANRFVATFLGTANLIEGEVVAGAQGPRFEAAAGIALALPDGASAASGPACIALRPQSIALAPLDTAGAGRQPLAGTILRREFLGGTIRYAVSLGPHHLVVDQPHRRDALVFAKGAMVAIMLDASQASLLR